MLVVNRILRRAVDRRGDETGAALVAIIIVMFFGFAVVTAVTASVMFTIQSNVGNRSSTQAYIAAESGRDAAVDRLNSAVASNGTFSCNSATLTGVGAKPDYAFTIYSTNSDIRPSKATDPGVAQACPTFDSKFVVIHSVGTDARGGSATLDAVYPWLVSYEQQAGGVLAYFAGGVTSTVSNYTGDLVVRSGNYSCANEGTINGDLYVTHGSVNLSRECTVNGNIWARNDVDASSQKITVTGDIKAGGTVTAVSNGSTFGKLVGTTHSGGNIQSGADIKLDSTGSVDGKVHGSLSAAGQVRIGGSLPTSGTTGYTGNKWAVTGSLTYPTPLPPFDPSLDFIKEITSWIDLDATSGWNAAEDLPACALTSAQITGRMTDATPGPIIFNYMNCSSVSTDITLTGTSVTPTKDVLFLAPPQKRMNISIETKLAGGKQIVFMHADASRALVSNETSPTCQNPDTANQKDTFSIGAGKSVSGVKLMIYSPCGLTGNINESFVGQLYSNDTGGVKFNNGATYTCALMSWPDAFEKLGCKVRGEGEDVVIETVLIQRPGDRAYQTEIVTTP